MLKRLVAVFCPALKLQITVNSAVLGRV
eukprot:SAG31_NODE_48094_length_199_cov_29.960000_1_plen_27_part_10